MNFTSLAIIVVALVLKEKYEEKEKKGKIEGEVIY
jgi:hypothetical protein